MGHRMVQAACAGIFQDIGRSLSLSQGTTCFRVWGHCTSMLAKHPWPHTAFQGGPAAAQPACLASAALSVWTNRDCPAPPALPQLCFQRTGSCCSTLVLSLQWHILQRSDLFNV